MKAITIRQPWAECVARGVKLVENRSQGFPKGYRGPLAIHAGLGWSERGRYDERVRAAIPRDSGPTAGGVGADAPWLRTFGFAVWHVPAYRGRPPEPFDAGAVIAVCDLIDIHSANGCCKPWGEDTYPPANTEARPPGKVTHLVLADVRRLVRPIPARGALGLWTPDPDLAEEILLATG